MQRKVFDRLASTTGAVIVVLLLIAGGLLTWGASFASSSVHDQLAAQQIYFPSQKEINTVSHQYATTGKTTDPEFPNKAMVAQLEPYAGQQVLTGKQAQVYANWFIAQHLYAMPYHGVYSQISGAAMAATPGSAKATSLTQLKTTSFMGTTLRGMLLTAYAFGTIGVIMFWGAIASFVGALILGLLVVGGFWHASRTASEERIFEDEPSPATTEPAPLATV
jgi:hypothetical protein